MTNDERIEVLAQEIYVNRHNQKNDVTGTDLEDFLDQTIIWVNQLIPEIEKARDGGGNAVDWNWLRTQDASIGTIVTPSVVSYDLPADIRKLVINYQRDLTIKQGDAIVASFKLVNPNQQFNPAEPYDHRHRATVLKRKIIFSRPLTDHEVGGTIIADTISKIPLLTRDDVALLDILDDPDYQDIRQLFIMGVVKNQILPDIVQGGLTPSYSQKFDRYLQSVIADNNESADSDDVERESLSYVGGVGFN